VANTVGLCYTYKGTQFRITQKHIVLLIIHTVYQLTHVSDYLINLT